MIDEELNKKIVDVAISQVWTDSFGDEIVIDREVARAFADALIAAGLTIVENKPHSYKVKNKQKHIEEMADIKSVLIKTHKRCRTLQEDYMQNKYAEGIYKAGYRKQSDVIKEFVEKVKDKFFYELDSERSINPVSIYRFTDKEIDELAAEFGAEVEE